ncbi:hypothetical protein HDF25_002136 [Pedobacter cryoconitis]|uniref:Uncharacterized protein n=1 Tax=Pedobacter cryoconitis TaxID=188932 RepID=A0A7X0J549_9SPHI|nr:hypothetical protein [Pedobacter cryoconitis]
MLFPFGRNAKLITTFGFFDYDIKLLTVLPELCNTTEAASPRGTP